MTEYVINLKSALRKLFKDQMVAGNQLVFREKEALLLTGIFVAAPILTILIAFLIK
jgi:hypothetical protein